MIGHGSLKPILTNNKNLLRKKSLFKKGHSFFERRKEYTIALTGQFELKPLSKSDLSAIRNKVIKDHKKETNRSFALLFLLLLPILFLSVYLKVIIKQENNKKVVDAHLVYVSENTEQFLYLLNSGNDWLSKKKYHNAIFQYEEALALFPKDTIANENLSLAYQLRCVNEQKDCDKIIEK